MKKLLSTFALALLAAASAWAQRFQSGDLYYYITNASNKTVAVTYEYQWSSSNYSSLPTTVTIPETVSYNGTTYSVTSIGDQAFYYCSALTQVNIPESVTSIGGSAFRYCSALTQVTIGDGVKSIGEGAFLGCSALTQVTIGDGVESIGNYAFFGCSALTQVTIGDGVTSIGNSAFQFCSALAEINVLATVPPTITASTFSNINLQVKVSIPEGSRDAYMADENWKQLLGLSEGQANGTCGDNLTWTFTTADSTLTISGTGDMYNSDDQPWYNFNQGIKNISLPDGMTSIGSYAFSSCSALTQVNIPESVTSIGDYAFSSCSALKQITLPESVTSIGDYAFSYCSALTQVTIPSSVTSIGDEAFYGCSALTQVTWNVINCADFNNGPFNDSRSNIKVFIFGNQVEHIPAFLCYYMDKLTQVTIPESVTSIGESAFSRCSALTQVIIGSSVTSIGSEAFSRCSALTQVTIPDGVESIGSSAFSYCSALTQVTIPDGVTSIGYYAFGYCSALTQVTIPGSVESIGERAFEYCSALAEMTVLPTVPPTITENTFSNINPQVKVSIPEGSRDAYMADENWKQLLYLSAGELSGTCGDYLIWTFTTADCTLSISGRGEMYDYNYPSDQPWYNFNQGIKNISIQDGVTSIGDYAFSDCSALTQVTIGDGVTSIGSQAFAWCSALAQVTIGDGVESIGERAFLGCSKLTQVNIPNSVTSIGDYAFSGCSALTQVTIPNSVTSIGEGAFSGCSALAEMTVLATVPPTITAYTFSNINPQVKVSIPEGSKEAYMADENWKQLLGLSAGELSGTCGDNLTWTFTTADSTLTISGTGNMYNYSHNNQPWNNFRRGIKTISLPDGMTSIGNGAFYNCSALTQMDIPNSVTSIGDSSFQECYNLAKIAIGNGVTSIGDWAFYDCSALAEMTVLATVPPTIGEASTFYNVSRDIPVYVPAEALEDYWVASVWKEFNLHAMPTALQTPSMPESMRVYGGLLHNPQGLPVSIYDMQGRMVYSGTAATVSQPAGVYVLRCAGASSKVLF